MASLSGALVLFLGAIPKVIGFAIILIVGWLVAGVLARGLAALLRRANFNGLAERSGFSGFVRSAGIGTDPSGAIAVTAKWFVRLITLIVAFDALGLPAVSQVLQQLLLWLPNVVVALVILVIAGLVANALAGVVRGATATAGFRSPDRLATVARAAVWGFGIIVAVNQLGIASTLLNTLFMAVVGAVALAAGLAFGLGGQDTAGQVVRNWYEQRRLAGSKFETAADAAAAEARHEIERRRPAA
ncbi:MAG: mechanosensitive ion channel family protein [Candidatus Rokuibacteriota bacterium]